MEHRHRLVILIVVASLTVGACGGMKTTRFTNPNFDFNFVEKVAVLQLENFSDDRQAGVRATRILITELLSTGAVDVVEPGEVRAALDRLSGVNRNSPSAEHIKKLGESLEVQAIIMGSVAQSGNLRSGTVSIPTVTLDVHMIETETATSVWAATHTEKGAGLGAKLLGTGGEPISETTRRCVRRIVATLVR